MGRPHEPGFGGDVSGDVLPVHRPVGPEGHDKADVIGKLGPLGGGVPGPMFEVPPKFDESIDDHPAISVGVVGNHDRTHTGTVIRNGVGTNLPQ